MSPSTRYVTDWEEVVEVFHLPQGTVESTLAPKPGDRPRTGCLRESLVILPAVSRTLILGTQS